MVAPAIYVAAASGAALIAAYKKGKSSGKSEGIEEGKEQKEEEITEEVREEIKEREISKEVKEKIKEKYRLEERAKQEFQEEQSWEAHQEAIKRDPPVDIGDGVKLGVKEIEKHYSGKTTAVCRKEGFYIFVNSIPKEIEKGDVIRAKITSFGEEKKSAQATYTGE